MFTYTGSDNSHQSLDAEEAIQAAVHSQYLDLSSRCLQSLPASLAVCGGLQVLHLSTNALQTLPALLGSLKTLTELDVSYNQLVSLPVEVASLTALTSLKLSYNRLESLGEEVAQLVSIRVLHLNDNQLVSVPAELSCLQGLEDLQLQYNSLSTLPQALSQLTQLTTLDLSGNPLPPPLLKVGAAGAATTAIDAALQKHILPIVPQLLQDEDPMPLYALKLLGGLLEVNVSYVRVVEELGLAAQFFDFLSLEHSNNNVHNIRLCRQVVAAGALPSEELQRLQISDKVSAVLEYAQQNNVEPFLEPVLELCHAIIERDSADVAGGRRLLLRRWL